jgi:hypothetical protein
MEPIEQSGPSRFGPLLGPLGPGLVALALLAFADPAAAGQQGGGTLRAAGTLLLELDANTSRFRLSDCTDVNGDRFCDSDGTTPLWGAGGDPFQVIFDQKIVKNNLGCTLGLAPPSGEFTGGTELVSIAASSPSDPGIDAGKFALGVRANRGTGCGQVEDGETFTLMTRPRPDGKRLLLADAQIQVEAKQDVSARVEVCLDECPVDPVDKVFRYLLTGNGIDNPPLEVTQACRGVPVATCPLVSLALPRNDGGPDSKEQDDAFWEFSAPLHNIEVYDVLTNSNGVVGKLSIKGGGEFPECTSEDPKCNPDDPRAAVRSTWLAFEAEGVLNCFERFVEADNFSGRRLLNDGVTDPTQCELIPYNADYFDDGQSVSVASFDATTGGQDVNFTFAVCFAEEHVATAVDPTLYSFRQDLDPTTCDSVGACLQTGTACSADCGVDGPCVFPCFALETCEGTPTYQCFGDSGPIAGTVGCVQNEARCFEDPECILCAANQSCELSDLAPPAGGFPDRDLAVPGINYACTFTSAEVYGELDKVTICEGIFQTDDAKALRRR